MTPSAMSSSRNLSCISTGAEAIQRAANFRPCCPKVKGKASPCDPRLSLAALGKCRLQFQALRNQHVQLDNRLFRLGCINFPPGFSPFSVGIDDGAETAQGLPDIIQQSLGPLTARLRGDECHKL